MPGTSKKPNKISFVSGNPTVEKTEGIIHLFKTKNKKETTAGCQTSSMLCMLGIPSNITVKDLLNFCAPMRFSFSFILKRGILELKIVKGSHVGRYMALLNFENQEYADQFYEALNGVAYNSLEPDICQLAYISHVEAIHSSLVRSTELLYMYVGRYFSFARSGRAALMSGDEPVQGILTTILCNHNFHDECISQTTETTCPVCRYVQSPEMVADSQCADCELRENLWICLICGHVGCGRYGQKHAHRHFQETGHTFALELGKNLVWDYADDAYVHRIAVNQEDGKLVQLGEGSETGDKKLDCLNTEFSAIMISQLESQRQYFESQLDIITSESAARTADIEDKLEKTRLMVSDLESKVATLTKEKTMLAQKLSQANTLTQKLQSELAEEKALTVSLSKSQILWEERAKNAELTAQMAQEEVRDLLLNFEMRDKLTEVSERGEVRC
uniref:UBP-type domain-containing protein n=1 Tax=Schistocephalus solidus TaxID=70667 RepID=A0A183SHV8_SCHSO